MPATSDLNTTFGPILIGVVVSAMLLGVIGVQTFYYFQNYSSDRPLVKIVVLLLLLLELLHSTFNAHAIYYYTIVNYMNPAALLDFIWSLSITPAVSCAVITVVHVFYIRRVYYMSYKNVLLVALITVLALARFGMGIAVSIKVFQLKHFTASTQIAPYVGSSISLSVATDITIAASLSFYLHKSRSGIQNTDTMINKLMVYTINNGFLTSIFGILIIIFVTSQPQTLILIPVCQILSNLYTNSMLSTLNSRRSMAQSGENTGISFRLPITVSMPSAKRPIDTKPDNFPMNMDDVEHQPTSQIHDSSHFTNSAMSLPNRVHRPSSVSTFMDSDATSTTISFISSHA